MVSRTWCLTVPGTSQKASPYLGLVPPLTTASENLPGTLSLLLVLLDPDRTLVSLEQVVVDPNQQTWRVIVGSVYKFCMYIRPFAFLCLDARSPMQIPFFPPF